MSTATDPPRAEVDESGVVSPTGALAEQAADTQDRTDEVGHAAVP